MSIKTIALLLAVFITSIVGGTVGGSLRVMAAAGSAGNGFGNFLFSPINLTNGTYTSSIYTAPSLGHVASNDYGATQPCANSSTQTRCLYVPPALSGETGTNANSMYIDFYGWNSSSALSGCELNFSVSQTALVSSCGINTNNKGINIGTGSFQSSRYGQNAACGSSTTPITNSAGSFAQSRCFVTVTAGSTTAYTFATSKAAGPICVAYPWGNVANSAYVPVITVYSGTGFTVSTPTGYTGTVAVVDCVDNPN